MHHYKYRPRGGARGAYLVREVESRQRDINDRFPQAASARDFDATGLVEFLQGRERSEGLKSYIKTDAAGCITQVFVQQRLAH